LTNFWVRGARTQHFFYSASFGDIRYCKGFYPGFTLPWYMAFCLRFALPLVSSFSTACSPYPEQEDFCFVLYFLRGAGDQTESLAHSVHARYYWSTSPVRLFLKKRKITAYLLNTVMVLLKMFYLVLLESLRGQGRIRQDVWGKKRPLHHWPFMHEMKVLLYWQAEQCNFKKYDLLRLYCNFVY
jgi:hypothetical protein